MKAPSALELSIDVVYLSQPANQGASNHEHNFISGASQFSPSPFLPDASRIARAKYTLENKKHDTVNVISPLIISNQ